MTARRRETGREARNTKWEEESLSETGAWRAHNPPLCLPDSPTLDEDARGDADAHEKNLKAKACGRPGGGVMKRRDSLVGVESGTTSSI